MLAPGIPGAKSTLGDESAVEPLQKVMGQRSQLALQHEAGERPADQAVIARKPTSAAKPTERRGRRIRE
jgi:hypothetical protein